MATGAYKTYAFLAYREEIEISDDGTSSSNTKKISEEEERKKKCSLAQDKMKINS